MESEGKINIAITNKLGEEGPIKSEENLQSFKSEVGDVRITLVKKDRMEELFKNMQGT